MNHLHVLTLDYISQKPMSNIDKICYLIIITIVKLILNSSNKSFDFTMELNNFFTGIRLRIECMYLLIMIKKRETNKEK